ncbi:MAG: hypothetical protein LBM13_03310 [Candidatus Ancillula sp.]|jgi:heme/copper-type cytochrome/quinol oxidase subunit 2|nr:hypothetical protein [Candidatus Ancillula sp.]
MQLIEPISMIQNIIVGIIVVMVIFIVVLTIVIRKRKKEETEQEKKFIRYMWSIILRIGLVISSIILIFLAVQLFGLNTMNNKISPTNEQPTKSQMNNGWYRDGAVWGN